MNDLIAPSRVWEDGELCEYDTVTVLGRQLLVVRSPQVGSVPWALPGGYSDAGSGFDRPSASSPKNDADSAF